MTHSPLLGQSPVYVVDAELQETAVRQEVEMEARRRGSSSSTRRHHKAELPHLVGPNVDRRRPLLTS